MTTSDDILDIFSKSGRFIVEMQNLSRKINENDNAVSNIYAEGSRRREIPMPKGALKWFIYIVLFNFVFTPFVNFGFPANLIISGIVVAAIWLARKYILAYNSKSADEYLQVFQKSIDNYKKQNKILEVEIENLCNSVYADAIKSIPEKYRNPVAISYMYECIVNKRADTLKEAINLFEAQVNIWRMQQTNQAFLDLQHQQTEYARMTEWNTRQTAHSTTFMSAISALGILRANK